MKVPPFRVVAEFDCGFCAEQGAGVIEFEKGVVVSVILPPDWQEKYDETSQEALPACPRCS